MYKDKQKKKCKDKIEDSYKHKNCKNLKNMKIVQTKYYQTKN